MLSPSRYYTHTVGLHARVRLQPRGIMLLTHTSYSVRCNSGVSFHYEVTRFTKYCEKYESRFFIMVING